MMGAWFKGVMSLRFSYRNGEFEYHIGWFWVLLLIASFWSVFS